MAGIIAQITRANRKRMDNRKNHVSIAKCMYHINPFDECFEPVASNSPTLKLISLALKKTLYPACAWHFTATLSYLIVVIAL